MSHLDYLTHRVPCILCNSPCILHCAPYGLCHALYLHPMYQTSYIPSLSRSNEPVPPSVYFTLPIMPRTCARQLPTLQPTHMRPLLAATLALQAHYDGQAPPFFFTRQSDGSQPLDWRSGAPFPPTWCASFHRCRGCALVPLAARAARPCPALPAESCRGLSGRGRAAVAVTVPAGGHGGVRGACRSRCDPAGHRRHHHADYLCQGERSLRGETVPGSGAAPAKRGGRRAAWAAGSEEPAGKIVLRPGGFLQGGAGWQQSGGVCLLRGRGEPLPRLKSTPWLSRCSC